MHAGSRKAWLSPPGTKTHHFNVRSDEFSPGLKFYPTTSLLNGVAKYSISETKLGSNDFYRVIDQRKKALGKVIGCRIIPLERIRLGIKRTELVES
jgi:hypothetical protein